MWIYVAHAWPLALIWICGAAVYSGVIFGSADDWKFITTWDDDTNFLDKELFKSPNMSFLSPELHTSVLKDVTINVWEPLALYLKVFTILVFGFRPIAFRYVGVFIHLSSSSMMYGLLRALLSRGRRGNAQEKVKYEGAERVASFLGALFYCVHPLSVENVCWPSALPYVLAHFFSICSIFFAIRGSEFHAVSCLLYVASVLSKSAVLLLVPAAIFSLELGFYCEELPVKQVFYKMLEFIWQKAFFIAAAVSLCFATLLANKGGEMDDIDTLTLRYDQRLFRAPVLLVQLISRIVQPGDCRAHYQFHEFLVDFRKNANVFRSLCVIPSLSLFLFVCRRRARVLFSCWIWAVFGALPILGIVQHGMVAMGGDRYGSILLFPAAHLVATLAFMAMTWNLENPRDAPLGSGNVGKELSIVGKVAAAKSVFAPHAMVTVVISMFLPLVSLGAQSHQLSLTWRNDETLWMHNLRLDKTDWRAADQLMEYYIGQGRGAEGKWLLPIIEQYSPQHGLKALLHRAKLKVVGGNLDEACSTYAHLAGDEKYFASPARGAIYNNLAVCILHRATSSEARAEAHMWFVRGLEQAQVERHQRTLQRNIDELRREWLDHDGRPKVNNGQYRGKHALIF